MNMPKLYALLPCLFGIEAALKEEVLQLGYAKDAIETFDGEIRVSLGSDYVSELFRLNLELRCAERVRLEIARIPGVVDFDSFFNLTANLPWEIFVPRGAQIRVDGSSRKSKLFGVPSLQSLAKKAIINRLLEAWQIKDGRISEDRRRGEIRIHFSFVSDSLSLSIDSSGEGLHKRGYRPLTHEAPLRETVAAAILYYTHFQNILRFHETLYDPCCGSGTFLIEAALIMAKIAPGLKRSFALETLPIAEPARFASLREEARARIQRDPSAKLAASDISTRAIQDAIANAERAGVAELIDFKQCDLTQLGETSLRRWPGGPGLILTNLPYGERLGDQESARKLTETLLDLSFKSTGASWQLAFLQLDEAMPDDAPRADKKRKVYNGQMAVTLHQYFKHRLRTQR